MASFLKAAVCAGLMLLSAILPAQSKDLSPRDIFRASHDAIVEIWMTDHFGRGFRGTGFFISPNLIATNHHAVHDARKITVRDPENKRHFTFRRILASDPEADTAIVEVAERLRHYLHLDASMRVEVGDPIFVIGNPQGYSESLSQGLVSGIRPRGKAHMYQITATVSPGSSGSPVLDARGDVIGIVFGRLPREAQIGFATPAASLVALSRGEPFAAPSPMAHIVSSHNMSPAPEATSLGTRDTTAKPPGNVIRIGVPNADSAIATAYILKAAIERFFGNRVELVPASHKEIFDGIAAGDGSFDIHPDVWIPNHRKFLRAGIHLNQTPYAATQGICVPRYMATHNGIRRLDDLASPQVARLFDTDGDGEGNIWIGVPGWESTNINRLKARDYGFAPYFNLDSYPEKNLYPRLASAIGGKRPIVFHCYGPHWMFRKYDLVQLREPDNNKTCFHLADDKTGSDWFEYSHASCHEPTILIHIAYSDRLVRRFPGVAGFLSGMSFQYDDLNKVIFSMIGNKPQKARVARLWVERNAERLQQLAAFAVKH